MQTALEEALAEEAACAAQPGAGGAGCGDPGCGCLVFFVDDEGEEHHIAHQDGWC